MNTPRLSRQVPIKGFLVLALVISAFQSFGSNAFATPSASPNYFQQGGNPPTLTCTSPSVPSSCNVHIVLLIDDSGSMRTNDPQSNRKEGAKHLVDTLAMQYYWLASEVNATGPRLPDVKVAVIHFSNRAIANSGWLQIKPGSRAEWETQRAYVYGIIDRPEEIREVDGTLFQDAFNAAAELFRSGDEQTTDGNCTRRSILLFSDGTPEDQQRGILQGQQMADEMAQVTTIVQKDLSKLDAIYITAFKVGPRYWTRTLENQWSKIARSPSQDAIPPVMSMSGKDYFLQLMGRMDEVATSLSDTNAYEKIVDLTEYQGLRVELEDQPIYVQQGQQRVIRFRFLNSLGSVIPSGGDAKSFPRLDVSVTELTQDNSFHLTKAEDHYQFSWTPANLEDNQFKVLANLTDANGSVLLNCSGIINVPVESSQRAPIILSLVLSSPRFPDRETITIPIQLNYEGNLAQLNSLEWNHSAKDLLSGKSFKTTIEPESPETGQYRLTIQSVGNASTIQVTTGMVAAIGSQKITVPQATMTIQMPSSCRCDPTWTIWFWPLAILFVCLLIVLLVLSIRPDWTEIDVQGERRLFLRTGDWQLLFVPWFILLVLLVLNRLLWCCILPPWLFLVLWLLPILFWIWRNPWYRRTTQVPDPIIRKPPAAALNWIVEDADEPGHELVLRHNDSNNEPTPTVHPSPSDSSIKTVPVRWHLRGRANDEIKISRRQ